MKTIKEYIEAVQSLVPATRTSTTNGTGVDTQGYTQACALITVGDIDTASGNETYVFSVEESADNSTFTAVSGLTATVTADNDVKYIEIPGVGTDRERYLRVVATLGGTTPSVAGGAAILLGGAFQNPTN